MQGEYSLRAEDLEWKVCAKDLAAKLSGTASKNQNVFPEHLDARTGPAGKDASELLSHDEIDALFPALESRACVEGDPGMRQIFKDVKQVEQNDYSY